MKPEEHKQLLAEFEETCDLVRLEAYRLTGYEWMVVPKTGANRTIKEQHKLFVQKYDGIDNDHDGKIDEADEEVTKADGGQSPHNFNLARDIVPMKSKGVIWWKAPKALFHTMGSIAEAHGLTWGGNFKSIYDPPHVESRKWKAVQTAWRAGELTIA